MPHIVLLGDSIFDNAAYVAGGPDVVAQLRAILPPGWRASLNAIDGAIAADVSSQLLRLPPGASHLVVSAGGNDALGEIGVLEKAAGSVADALARLAAVRERVRDGYPRVMGGLARRAPPPPRPPLLPPRRPRPP